MSSFLPNSSPALHDTGEIYAANEDNRNFQDYIQHKRQQGLPRSFANSSLAYDKKRSLSPYYTQQYEPSLVDLLVVAIMPEYATEYFKTVYNCSDKEAERFMQVSYQFIHSSIMQGGSVPMPSARLSNFDAAQQAQLQAQGSMRSK